MAKDSFWFKHDYNARNDEKILELMSEHGAEAYGIYWMLVETMAETENGGVKASLIGGLSHGFRVAKDRLKQILDACITVELFYEKDGFYYSNRMLKHKEERKFFSDMGKEGAERKKQKNRGASGGFNRGEEIRGEKKKGISFDLAEGVVIFQDGSKQKLGLDQLEQAKENRLKPNSVIKGSIY